MRMQSKKKFVRISTVPSTLNVLLKNQLKFLNSHFEIIALSSFGNDLLEVRNREEVSIKVINFKREISFFQDLKSLLQTFIYFKSIKPEFIQSNTPKASLISMIAGFFAGTKFRIYLVTGLRYETESGFKRRVLIFFEKVTSYFATHIIAESTGVKELLISDNITSKEIEIIGNGNINGIDLVYWDPALFSPEFLKGVKESLNIVDSYVFVFIGRLVGDKGINELVEVFQKLAAESKNKLKLLLVGDYEDTLDSLSLTTKNYILNNKDIVHLTFKEDVRKYLLVSNCLVLPSYREGFSNVSLQAGAMGLPVIITDVNGASDVIQNQVNGIIIKKKNKSELYQTMKNFAENRFQYNSEAIRDIIKIKFSQENYYKELLKYYNKL